MLKIGWFSTGRGEGSRGLLSFVQDRIDRGRLDAGIEFVFSNREPGEAEGSDQFFALAQGYGLDLVTLSSAKFRRGRKGPFSLHREEFDHHVAELLSPFSPDICVLAGYMLIVSGYMCLKYPLLNLHPALPNGPTGTWQEVIWALLESRASHTGDMVHLATPEVDRGPVVSYCTVPITGGSFDPLWAQLTGQDLARLREEQGEELPLFQLIRSAGYRKEPYLLFETLRYVADGRVAPRPSRALDSAGNPLAATHPSGLCLDQAVERAMGEDGLLP